ncbi:Hypothetical predicted protein [Mytilus galloprovincialis]|uniref:Uncharacterized protein n=1 Tax=Mytilus galloprovincialis TaxID=29158 RepID=A0A8B6C2Z2_MYTGA|nr:Hypothetical predicted protein [Mytilus galloprovincialis]
MPIITQNLAVNVITRARLTVFDQPTRRVLWSRGSPKTVETPVVEEPATIAWESKARKRLFSPGPSFGTMESFLDLAVVFDQPTRRVLWSRGSPKTIETPVVEEPATIAWESKARKRLFSPGPSFGTMESFLDLAVVFDQPTRRVLWSRGSPKTIETPVVEEPATIAWESKARKRLFSPGPSFGTMESFLDLAVTIAWESKARKRLFSPGPSFGTMESFLDLAVVR